MWELHRILHSSSSYAELVQKSATLHPLKNKTALVDGRDIKAHTGLQTCSCIWFSFQRTTKTLCQLRGQVKGTGEDNHGGGGVFLYYTIICYAMLYYAMLCYTTQNADNIINLYEIVKEFPICNEHRPVSMYHNTIFNVYVITKSIKL